MTFKVRIIKYQNEQTMFTNCNNWVQHIDVLQTVITLSQHIIEYTLHTQVYTNKYMYHYNITTQTSHYLHNCNNTLQHSISQTCQQIIQDIQNKCLGDCKSSFYTQCRSIRQINANHKHKV